MKIALDISNDTLIAVNTQLNRVYDLPTSLDQSAKIVISMTYDLADKFDKKYRNRIQNQDLFDNKKRVKVKLKFHEAWALYEYLKLIVSGIQNDYHLSLVNKLSDVLHQKLS